MKLLTLLTIIIAGMFSSSFPTGGDPNCCFKKEHFAQESWYNTMCTELSKQAKIDWSTANMIHMVSSTRIPGQSDDDAIKNKIKTRGFITPGDIVMICKVPERRDMVYIITADEQYHFLFSFAINNKELKRIRNKTMVVVTTGSLKMKEHSEDGFTLYSSSAYSDWRGYFQYKRSEEIFIHQKNCKVVNGKEECKVL